MHHSTKKKGGPWLIVSIASCFIVLLAIVAFIFTQKLPNFGQQVADANEIVPVIETTELHSPFKAVKLFSESYTTPSSTYIIEYPQVENDSVNDTILHYINSEKELFLSLVEKNENSVNDAKNNFTITLDTSKYNKQYYSFTLHSTSTFGDLDAEEKIATFVYDAQSAGLVTFEQLLHGNLRYLNSFAVYAKQQLAADEALTSSLADEETLDNILTNNWDSYTNFALDEDELVVYFQPGDVADKTQGIVAVKGPIAYFNSILSKTFQSTKTTTSTLPLVKDNHKRVALTFDDGPHPKVTEQILDILDEFDAKATFFMLGKNIEQYPEIVKDIYARGHEIGNHSWSHPVLTKLSLKEAKKEYNETEQILIDTIGENSTVFRAPYGAINDNIKAFVPTNSVSWSLDTLDWKYKNASKTFATLKAHMHNNAIILMHDIHQPTADSLRTTLKYLQSQGYEFLTTSEILSYTEYEM